MINTNGILRMENKEFARVNNFSILPSTFTSPDKPVAEGYANAIENTRGDKIRKVVGKTYSENGKKYLAIMQTGRPVESFKDILDLGHDPYEKREYANNDNHLFHIGEKYFLSYFSPVFQEYEIASKYTDHFEFVTGPYIEDFPHYTESNLKKWPYGEFTTVVTVLIENEDLDLSSIPDELERKFRWEMLEDPNLEIWFEDVRISPKLHADALKKKSDIEKALYSEKDKDKPQIDILAMQSGIKKAVVSCPVINGEIEIISMKAKSRSGSTDTKGISIYNRGILVEYSCTDIIAQLSSYKKKTFKCIDKGRKETNPYATYINLLPGPGVQMPFASDKQSINWTNSKVGIDLRIFIDDLVGNVYREAFRKAGESGARKDIDNIIDAICEGTNYVAFKEAAFDFYGKESKVDNIVIPITKSNRKKYEDFLNSKKKHYFLTEEDFKDVVPTEKNRLKNWSYNFFFIEYKNIDVSRFSFDDVDQACRYAVFLSKVFKLEKSRIPVKVIGAPKEKWVQEYIDFKKEEGYNVISAPYPVIENA